MELLVEHISLELVSDKMFDRLAEVILIEMIEEISKEIIKAYA